MICNGGKCQGVLYSYTTGTYYVYQAPSVADNSCMSADTVMFELPQSML